MNELNKLYLSMLQAWGAIVKDDGQVKFLLDGEEHPIRIDEMQMYLPTSDVLETQCSNKVFFHPGCENITSKETEVFKIIRKMTCLKLMTVFRSIPPVLFAVATGEKPKKAWRQHTIDLMEPLKTAKPMIRKEVSALFARLQVELSPDGLDNRFVHFKVSKASGRNKDTGERVYYKTKPQFPFYNEMVKRLARSEGQSDNQTVELNNFTVSRAALKLGVHLFQGIIPGVMEPDDCEAESTNPIGARLVSYLGSYAEVAEQINKVQNLFRSDFDKAGIYNVDLNWMDQLEELPEIYRQVPIMDYNSHNTQEEGVQQANVSGLFAVNSNLGNQHQQQQQQNNGNNNNGNFDMTPPIMLNGDRYLNAHVDYGKNNVVHMAVSQNGNSVTYLCSRFGNFLQRNENAPQPGNYYNNGYGGHQGGYMMVNGQPMMMQPVVAGGTIMPSVTTDYYGNNNGNNNNTSNTVTW